MNKRKIKKITKKSFNILNKLSWITAISGSTYKLTTLLLKHNSNKVAQTNDKSNENTIGYDNVKLLNNKTVHTNNFVILHTNSDMNVEVLKEKLEFCEQNNISIGLIIDSKDTEISTLFKDFDLIQATIKDYNIDFPVYFNIDKIMENANLNNTERKMIITTITDKAEACGIYMGLYGTDKNLTNCNQYVMSLNRYDCYLVQDSNEITYNGNYNITKDLEGNITSKKDLAEIIKNNSYNNREHLTGSTKYTIKEGDTLSSIALTYNISETDLKKYNDIKEIKIDDTILIPNIYVSPIQPEEPTEITTTKESDFKFATYRGIDISCYQSKNIDWEKVSNQFNFVIVEVAQDSYNHTTKDGKYLTTAIGQIENVTNQELDLGLYFCISYDMSTEIYAKRMEDYLTKLDKEMEEKNINLDKTKIPVFLDFESFCSTNEYYNLMKVFEKACNAHGYAKIGIYGNKDTLSNISKQIYETNNIKLKNTEWYIWEAGGSYYIPLQSEKTHEGYSLEEIKDVPNIAREHYTPTILQASNACNDSGAPTDYGKCDINFYYEPTNRAGLFESFIEDEFIEEYIEEIEVPGPSQIIDINSDKFNHLNINSIINILLTLGFIIVGITEVSKKVYKLEIQKKQKNKRLTLNNRMNYRY